MLLSYHPLGGGSPSASQQSRDDHHRHRHYRWLHTRQPSRAVQAPVWCYSAGIPPELIISLFHQLCSHLLYLIRLLSALYLECQERALWGDIKRAGCTFNEWETAVAADGETTAYRNVHIVQVGYQHLFYATVLQIVSNGIECSEDNALNPMETVLQKKRIKQPVDGVQ